MMRTTILCLAAAAALTACHPPRVDNPDYQSVRERSEASHQNLDRQQVP
jgi:hypothetical protein